MRNDSVRGKGRARQRGPTWLTVALLFVVLGACGGAVESTAPTLPSLGEAPLPASPTTTVAVDPEQAFETYTACMQDNGVDMPDAPDDGGVFVIEHVDDAELSQFEEAEAECGSILEDAFGEFDLTPEEDADMRDRELAFAQCMRDNGVDWPDPDSSGSTVIEIDDNVDPELIDSALKTCGQDSPLGGATGDVQVREAP